jgi:hypothetical protein
VLYTAVAAEIAQPDWSAAAAFLPAAFALGCAGTSLVVLPSGYRGDPGPQIPDPACSR